MSAIDLQLPPATSSRYSDSIKNDFQTAIRRNLHSWVRWRTKLNDTLVEAVITRSALGTVEPIRQYLVDDAPDPDHPTSNPRTLLTFSASSKSSTNLHTKDFVKYGIPRAKLDPRLNVRTRSSNYVDNGQSDDDHGDGDDVTAAEGQRDLRNKKEVVNGSPVSENNFDDHEDDDLAFDYFYQDKSEAVVSISGSISNPTTRRFHRSAATLPVVPPVDDDGPDRRSRRTLKAEHRRLAPSYMKPFIRSGSGFITARRDDQLYTRSAGILDEL